MANQSQKIVVNTCDEESYAVYHLVDLREKRRAEKYFEKLGFNIAFYFLTIFKEPGECEAVKVHSLYFKNPSRLEKALRSKGNHDLADSMKIEKTCQPRQAMWSVDPSGWINMASGRNRWRTTKEGRRCEK